MVTAATMVGRVEVEELVGGVVVSLVRVEAMEGQLPLEYGSASAAFKTGVSEIWYTARSTALGMGLERVERTF